jgi:hypothetical protein
VAYGSGVSAGADQFGEGGFVLRPGSEFLFWVGQDTLGRWGSDPLARVGLNGFDLGEDLLLRLAHRSSFGGLEPMRDYALLLPARGDVRQDCRWGRLAEAGRRPDEV